ELHDSAATFAVIVLCKQNQRIQHGTCFRSLHPSLTLRVGMPIRTRSASEERPLANLEETIIGFLPPSGQADPGKGRRSAPPRLLAECRPSSDCKTPGCAATTASGPAFHPPGTGDAGTPG